ncbi:hypothetical protein K437DRAFT_189924 [Tilletiaria anomala UBC 951]|uniref:Uncharacterized protein n=1 Tax=Tilletiaria anomala (strain ATCC 24038 / CBS 436.72 / UBC 951) TaxID=1037660 RepID=A0A066VP80_TILAU|nr:uncharacterized protein K437DRAFT_189924 [Tilletiaria anomala UBC 951]KDN40340.1 hypothetical protein K437DRAFT_189924 [Tilletiaria anomala UBC 951]
MRGRCSGCRQPLTTEGARDRLEPLCFAPCSRGREASERSQYGWMEIGCVQLNRVERKEMLVTDKLAARQKVCPLRCFVSSPRAEQASLSCPFTTYVCTLPRVSGGATRAFAVVRYAVLRDGTPTGVPLPTNHSTPALGLGPASSRLLAQEATGAVGFQLFAKA